MSVTPHDPSTPENNAASADKFGAGWTILGWIIFLFASALFKVLGLWFLIPTGVALLSGFLIRKAVKRIPTYLQIAFALQVGELCLTLYEAVLRGMVGIAMFDVLLIGGGLWWLLARPGTGPIAVLGLYQGMLVLWGAGRLADSSLSELAKSITLIHVGFKSAAIVALVWSVVCMKFLGTKQAVREGQA